MKGAFQQWLSRANWYPSRVWFYQLGMKTSPISPPLSAKTVFLPSSFINIHHPKMCAFFATCFPPLFPYFLGIEIVGVPPNHPFELVFPLWGTPIYENLQMTPTGCSRLRLPPAFVPPAALPRPGVEDLQQPRACAALQLRHLGATGGWHRVLVFWPQKKTGSGIPVGKHTKNIKKHQKLWKLTMFHG